MDDTLSKLKGWFFTSASACHFTQTFFVYISHLVSNIRTKIIRVLCYDYYVSKHEKRTKFFCFFAHQKGIYLFFISFSAPVSRFMLKGVKFKKNPGFGITSSIRSKVSFEWWRWKSGNGQTLRKSLMKNLDYSGLLILMNKILFQKTVILHLMCITSSNVL